jgi:hypothetical protein
LKPATAPRVPLLDLDLPPHDPDRDRFGKAVTAARRDRDTGQHRGAHGGAHAAGHRPPERFLILNGMNQGDALNPDEKVKIVTE